MRRGLVIVSLWLVGCFSSKDNALFERSPVTTGDGSPAAQAGTGSGSSAIAVGGGSVGGGSGVATENGGSSGSGGANGGGPPEATGGSSGGSPPPPPVKGCNDIDGSVVDERSGHCYRVNLESLTFAAARAACQAGDGHLATVSDEAENDFLHGLHDDEHWIGATDGREDRSPGVGTYSWVDAEPWSYEGWQGGQPNAHDTDCPGESGGAHCFEHCAYQTKDGGWIDRACWHTIASICEWELEGSTAPGQAGAGP